MESKSYMQTPSQGQLINEYRILRKLGEGSYGLVYEVQSERDRERKALKLLKLWAIPNNQKENLSARFRLEYETGKIQSPYLVQTHDYGYFGDNPYFVMDYCPNGSLRQRISAGMEPDEVMETSKDILYGLEALHSSGKIHRDLKPENVLFGSQSRAKLADFGIAGHINIQLTQAATTGEPGQIMGSYAYMAPEQLSPTQRTDTLLARIDLFAFGVLCFEMFTSHFPFGPWEHESDLVPYLNRAAQGQYSQITQYTYQTPPIWEKAIYACLTPNPLNRPQNVAELCALLNLQLKTDAGRASFKAALQILQGDEYGKIITLADKLPDERGCVLTMGRSGTEHVNGIPIQEKYTTFISRRHASLEWHPENNCWFLRDGQFLQDKDGSSWSYSKNGTYVNGKRVDMDYGHPLNLGDVITIGNTTLKVIKTQ